MWDLPLRRAGSAIFQEAGADGFEVDVIANGFEVAAIGGVE